RDSAGEKPDGGRPGRSRRDGAAPGGNFAASYSGRCGRREPKVRAVPAWRTAREPGGVHGRSEIPPPNVYVAYRDRNDHHWKGVEGIGRESKADPVAFGNARHGEVCRSADQRAIAAEAGAEREAPPQRLD